MTPTVLDEVNRLMQQIAKWQLPETGKYYDAELQRPMSYEMCYGSNGAREYMRNLAQDALSLLVTPPDVKETHNSSGFQNRSLNDISKRAKCFAKRFKSGTTNLNASAEQPLIPNDWETQIYNAMETAFQRGKHHDEGMVFNDTQLGVEFAIKHFAKWLASPTSNTEPTPDYKAQRDYLLVEMEKLACLGNGDKYGTSTGNCIAIAAIKKCNITGK